MAQGRRTDEAQSSIPRLLTSKLSPRKSLKRVGPVISEVLRTSVRPQNLVAAKQQKQQRFRPKSGADAILYLDEESQPVATNRVREGDAREPRGSESSQSIASILKKAPPMNGRYNVQPTVPSRIVTTEPKAAPNSGRKGAVKIQLPGLLVDRQPKYTRSRRVSKALPSLPPPTPSPARASFAAPPRPPKDIFHQNKEKIIRGQGSSTSLRAPPMSVNRDSSSGSSYDSAEQTWNMINNMMNAVNEDQVKSARRSVIHNPDPRRQTMGVQGAGAYVTFPRMHHPKVRKGVDEWGSGESTLSDQTYRSFSASSTETSSTYRSVRRELKERKRATHFAGTFPRARAPPSLQRQSSAASAFSIVIQPARELSNEAQDALVAEENLPKRIKGILQGNHGIYEPSLCSRTCSTKSSEGAELHPDLALTIDTLRDIELDDITFT